MYLYPKTQAYEKEQSIKQKEKVTQLSVTLCLLFFALCLFPLFKHREEPIFILIFMIKIA